MRRQIGLLSFKMSAVSKMWVSRTDCTCHFNCSERNPPGLLAILCSRWGSSILGEEGATPLPLPLGHSLSQDLGNFQSMVTLECIIQKAKEKG